MAKLTELINAITRLAVALERMAAVYEAIAKEEKLWNSQEELIASDPKKQ